LLLSEATLSNDYCRPCNYYNHCTIYDNGILLGAIRQLLAVTGLLASIVVASRFAPSVSDALHGVITDDAVAMLIAVLLIMMAVSGSASLIASIIQHYYGLIALGWIDHIIGALLGTLQAILLSVMVLLVTAAFPNQIWVDMLRASSVVNLSVYMFGGVVLTFVLEPLQQALRIVVFR
jgi:membrane protein required for colicin V production